MMALVTDTNERTSILKVDKHFQLLKETDLCLHLEGLQGYQQSLLSLLASGVTSTCINCMATTATVVAVTFLIVLSSI
jgi:hypothetical protein